MPPIRLGGVSSGLDTEGIIKQTLQIWRRPADLMELQAGRANVRAAAWREISKRFATVKTKLDALGDTTLFGQRTSTSSDATVITATADGTSVEANYAINVTKLAQARSYKSTVTTITDPAAATGHTGTVEVLNADGSVRGSFTIDGTTGSSLNDIAREINEATSTLKMKASVLATNPGEYHLVVAGTETGWDNRYRFRDNSGTVMQSLGVLDGAGNDVAGAMVADAQNAEFTVGGLSIARASNTVSDAIPGVTLNLLKVGSSTLDIKLDTNNALSAIEDFVSSYNSAASYIRTKGFYNRETKKSGDLAGDTGLMSLMGDLSRRTLGDVTGLPATLNSLIDMGITTKTDGQLTIDETKLKDLLKTNPTGVKDVFQKATDGLTTALGDWLEANSKSGGALESRAEVLDKTAKRLEERMRHFDEVVLPLREEQLRKKFTALERALSSAQNQGSWLGAQVTNLQKMAGK